MSFPKTEKREGYGVAQTEAIDHGDVVNFDQELH